MRTRSGPIGLAAAAVALACMLPSATRAQGVTPSSQSCDSILRAARVDSVAVGARAYLIRRDGEILPPRLRSLLLESILSNFTAPQPLVLPVFSPGPAPLRMLRPERLADDSVSSREPVLYGVYDFSILRSGAVTRIITTVPAMTPEFDARVAAAINGMAADSTAAVATRALDADAVALELRISTGPGDSRFRVPPATIFTSTFPR